MYIYANIQCDKNYFLKRNTQSSTFFNKLNKLIFLNLLILRLFNFFVLFKPITCLVQYKVVATLVLHSIGSIQTRFIGPRSGRINVFVIHADPIQPEKKLTWPSLDLKTDVGRSNCLLPLKSRFTGVLNETKKALANTEQWPSSSEVEVYSIKLECI